MSAANGSAVTQESDNSAAQPMDKGKGKAVDAQDISMDEGEDSSSEEEVNEVIF